MLTDFVDDMMGCAATEAEAWDVFTRVIRFFLRVGVPVSNKPNGLRPPCQTQVWVGWVFDTVKCTIGVWPAKAALCRVRWAAVLEADDRRDLRAKQLAGAAGLASHIREIFLQGRRRLHHVWSDLNRANV